MGNQQYWVKSYSSWPLTINGSTVTDFQRPSAYVTGDIAQKQMQIDSNWYKIEYAGVAVDIGLHNNVSDLENGIKQGRYTEVDLGQFYVIAGLILQYGYCKDVDNNLMDPIRSWIATLAVSYSMDGMDFEWVVDSNNDIWVSDLFFACNY